MSRFSDEDSGYSRIVAALTETRLAAFPGIHEEEGAVVTRPGGPNVATIAAIQEFGTATIPARPWLSTYLDLSARWWAERLGRATDRALMVAARGGSFNRSITGSTQFLGRTATLDMQRVIARWTEPPNAPSTVRKKGRNDPLVDTGRMMRSVSVKLTLDGKPPTGER